MQVFALRQRPHRLYLRNDRHASSTHKHTHTEASDLFVVPISRLYPAITGDPRIAELMYEGNEVIEREIEDRRVLQFGIGTMARERDNREETMTTKEAVEMKRERENETWYVGAAVLESVPDREEKKESGSV